MSGARSGDSELNSLIRILEEQNCKKKISPKPGGFGQHKVGSCVEVVLGGRVWH